MNIKNPAYGDLGFESLLDQWTTGKITRFEFERSLEKFFGAREILRSRIDIGAISTPNPNTITFAILIEYLGMSYRVNIDANHTVTVDLLGEQGPAPVCCDDGLARDVIGYAIRRAICRGIDKSELVETREVPSEAMRIEINLGKLKRHKPSCRDYVTHEGPCK